MKTLLITLNSKFTHTSLALRCLRSVAREEVELLELTVNQPADELLRRVLSVRADVYAFSVYVFNLVPTCKLMSDLHRSRPEAVILCGGPEVSYECESFLREHPYVDGIMRGEGESVFPQVEALLAHAADRRRALRETPCAGLSVLRDGDYCEAPSPEPICDLSALPFPYEAGELEELGQRILYYESSRGCPYTCIYCLSSVQGRVRYRSLERVFEDLQRFLDAKVSLVKFVDRTFNCDRKRALAIWRYLKDHDNGITSFHFEVSAWLLSEEELQLLESFRPDMILLEAGIQSTNPDTLAAITRRTDPEALYRAVRRLAQGPCHVHTDLIAGLPYEDLASFRRSFDLVFSLKSQCLQLGFLKRLKGTALSHRQDGAEYSQFPPYEILRNQWLSPEDLSVLKGVEKVLEKYWNSGLCRHLLSYCSDNLPEGVFNLFVSIASAWDRDGLFYLSLTPPRLFALMAEHIEEFFPNDMKQIANALLCHDRFVFERCHTVAEWQSVTPDRDRLLELLKSGRVESLLTEEQAAVFRTMNSVQWFRNSDLATFPCTPDGAPVSETRLFLYGPLGISLALPQEN
ncbi:MAG: DUF4080 domain-containing protein [Clostridia bacterium]|nr:DUF4080 domain-containing protein [Clostridia bacterium]